jgi:hypothetical protein
MATKKTKKTKNTKSKHALRNGATAAALSRPRPTARARTTSHDDGSNTLQAAKVAGGMLGATLACAIVAKQDWLPPKALTGATAAVGAALALAGNSNTLRDVGYGVMGAAGGQLGLLLIDDHQQNKPNAQVANAAPAKKPANAETLPPGALESAYERARARLAMTRASEVAA